MGFNARDDPNCVMMPPLRLATDEENAVGNAAIARANNWDTGHIIEVEGNSSKCPVANLKCQLLQSFSPFFIPPTLIFQCFMFR
jgi:hypothetical protein